MKKIQALVKKYSSHALARDSAIMFAGSMGANVASYFYHLLMGRLLGPVGYGELSSLLSIFYIFTVPLNVGSLVLIKFISECKAHGEIGQAKTLFLKVTKAAIICCALLFPVIAVTSPWVTGYLHIVSPVMFIIVYTIFVFSLLTVIMASVLQGYQKFVWVSVLGVGAVAIKLILSIPAVHFHLMGVLLATLMAVIISYGLNFLPLRFLFQAKELAMKITKWDAIKFAVPTLFVTLGMTSLYSTDMILVRHYFQAFDAGLYASLAVLGKIIFYASSVLAIVFYPILAERTAKQENTDRIVLIGLGSVTIISLAITICYFLFPAFIIRMLFGNSYTGGSGFLGMFGVFLVFYSIANMFTTTFLARGKTAMWSIPVICAGMQIAGIMLFHDTIRTVIWINIAVSALLVTGLSGYYWYTRNHS